MKLQKSKSLRTAILTGLILIFIFAGIFLIVLKIQNKHYTKIMNDKINLIVNNVVKNYPDVKEEDILKILNDKNNNSEDILKKYGYDNEISNINELQKEMDYAKVQDLVLITLFGLISLSVYLVYVINQEKKIKEINAYINQINNKNYTLKIKDNDDDELSKLRNELYKTTIILKEAAENSKKEKEELSTALADISHQLKTPLTSIRIMLDNINDNPDMAEDVRNDFILEISKQVDWISSLVISLLKIAKFDAGTIKMENEKIDAQKLINDVIDSLAILIEVKEIKIETNIDKNASFIADYKWQKEALINILKNSVEHSYQGSKILITVENNSVFLKIKIQDYGQGISKEDLKHIFERFYKAKNSSEDSIGIGLSLSKAIIEKNNGYIKVDSEPEKGSTFEIKYMK